MDADIFIPVTLGSKRFHHKHLREINGKPLLKYKNVTSTRPTFKYKEYITHKGKDFFSAKDVYMKYDGGEIH